MLEKPVKLDPEGLMKNLRREGTPSRVYHMELGIDMEIRAAVVERFGIGKELDTNDPRYTHKWSIELHRFLGYDYYSCGVKTSGFPRDHSSADDTAPLDQRRESRSWTNEHLGPIQTWQDFEEYPWPDPEQADTSDLEWCNDNLPDDMCLRSGACQIFEQVTWLMGYEGLCIAIYDQPDLVDAMFQRVGEIFLALNKLICQFPRVGFLISGDDMGFKTQTMIDPQILIDKALSWHKKLAEVAHQSGKLYLIHSCGNLEALMPAMLDAGIDGRHSFEDVIEPVTEIKKRWGDKMALLGGIDMSFLTLADEMSIRKRVRETLDICQEGGGYCLGSGNTVANYIPLDNYLTMLDEGRAYA